MIAQFFENCNYFKQVCSERCCLCKGALNSKCLLLQQIITFIIANILLLIKYTLTCSTKKLIQKRRSSISNLMRFLILSYSYTVGAKLLAIRCQIWHPKIRHHMYSTENMRASFPYIVAIRN